ncbi:MAG: sensor histidine kinase [Rhodoplanes sp.]
MRYSTGSREEKLSIFCRKVAPNVAPERRGLLRRSRDRVWSTNHCCGYIVQFSVRCVPMINYDHSDYELRLLFEAAPNGMIVTDQDGVITFANKQIEKLFGYPRGELIGRSIEVLIPERFRAAHPMMRAAFVKCPTTRPMGKGRDLYGLRKDSTEFPIEIGLNPFRSGERMLVAGSIIDITERKRNEEHIRFVMNELSHRSKNLLMVVLAIANQTVRRATSFGEFQKNFENRLLAIARCHDLLVEKGWEGASIEALISAQLKPFMDDPTSRVDAAGPPIMLNPDAAQNISLALHELATNAMKYGALSSPGGRIVIRWDIDDLQTPKKFRFSWQERGVPLSSRRPMRGSATNSSPTSHRKLPTRRSGSPSPPVGSPGASSARRRSCCGAERAGRAWSGCAGDQPRKNV